MSFGSKVQDLRNQNNITQEQLADRLNVTRQTISRWETDVAYPDLAKVVQLADIFNVSTDYLLRNENSYIEANTECSKFLTKLVGKNVKINCYTESDLFFDFPTKIVKVISVDNKFINVEKIDKKKNTVEKIIVKVEDIASISILEDD